MKFLDKLNLRRFTKLAAVAAVSGSLIFGGNAVVSAKLTWDKSIQLA